MSLLHSTCSMIAKSSPSILRFQHLLLPLLLVLAFTFPHSFFAETTVPNPCCPPPTFSLALDHKGVENFNPNGPSKRAIVNLGSFTPQSLFKAFRTLDTIATNLHTVKVYFDLCDLKSPYDYVPRSLETTSGELRQEATSNSKDNSKDSNNKSLSKLASLYGDTIDEVLASRPWWQVREEKVFPYEYKATGASSCGRMSPHPWNQISSGIVLDRIHEDIVPYMKFLSSMSFQNEAGCAKTPVTVKSSNMQHPGWNSRLSYVSRLHSYLPYAIQVIYRPRFLDELNGFMSNQDCPGRRNNLWNCAFLKTTNCSLPSTLRSKSQFLQIAKDYTSDEFGALIFDSTARAGNICKEDPKILHDLDTTLDFHSKMKILCKNTTITAKLSSGGFNTNKYTDLKLWRLHIMVHFISGSISDRQIDTYIIVDIAEAHYIHNFILRKSYFYRAKIDSLLANFRSKSKPHFSKASRCVAVHVRRGDRIMRLEGASDAENSRYILDFCKNASKEIHERFCVYPNGDARSGENCDGVDLGCFSYPFQQVTLQDVVQNLRETEGEILRYIDDMVVMTDDPVWLQQQVLDLEQTHPHLHVHAIEEPSISLPSDVQRRIKKLPGEPYSGYHKLRTFAETESGIFLFAQLELMTQCEGLFAHFDSQFAEFILQAMCIAHGPLGARKSNQCPPTFDFRALRHQYNLGYK